MSEISQTKWNLFKIVDQNVEEVKNHYREIEKEYTVEGKTLLLKEFIEFNKKNWCISINLKQSEINSFLISGIYKNMYQVIEDDLRVLRREQGLDISIEDAARNRMGIHYGKRKTFENQFEDGDRFIYAAFSIGGLGLKKYGNFCLIIHQKEIEKFSSCAFLRKESIAYVDNDVLNIEQVKKDTANSKTVHLLAAIKNEKEIPDKAKEEWPEMICSEKDYIEALTIDEISVGHISTVRVSKESENTYYNYLYKSYSSRLDEAEKRQLGNYRDMLKLLENNNINKETVDERGT